MEKPYFCRMDFQSVIIPILLLLFLNIIVFFIFKSLMYGKENAGMKFLFLNISKDVVWLIYALSVVEKTNQNMLVLIFSFLAISFAVYFVVIKLLNKS